MEGGRWEGSRIVSEVVVGGGEVEGRGDQGWSLWWWWLVREGECRGG